MANRLIEQIPGIKRNYPLKLKTTMKVGGPAKYFYQARSVSDLVKAVKTARRLNIPHLVLGGGSNLIFADQGYDGLVIENRSNQLVVQDGQISADSGVFLETMIRNLAEQGNGGLEFLAGIPGTVGGAIVNNAGAFGLSISKVLISCLILDEKGHERIAYPKELEFKYRSSKLKGKTEGESFPVVLRTVLRTKVLTSGIVKRQIDNYQKIRAKTQPAGLFSAGCIFSNPKIKGEIPEEWQDRVKKGRISAGYLLDLAEAKKLKIRQAEVSDRHANFIINRSRAKADEIKELADQMKRLVKDKYGISLIREVEFIGKFKKI